MKSFYKLTMLALSSLTFAMLQGQTTVPEAVSANQSVLAAPATSSETTQDVPTIENPPLTNFSEIPAEKIESKSKNSAILRNPKVAELESKLNNSYIELDSILRDLPANNLVVKAYEESVFGESYKHIIKKLSEPNLSEEQKQRLEQFKIGYEETKKSLEILPDINVTIEQIERFIKENDLAPLYIDTIEFMSKVNNLEDKPEIKQFLIEIDKLDSKIDAEKRPLYRQKFMDEKKELINKIKETPEIKNLINDLNQFKSRENLRIKKTETIDVFEPIFSKIRYIKDLGSKIENIRKTIESTIFQIKKLDPNFDIRKTLENRNFLLSMLIILGGPNGWKTKLGSLIF